MLGFAAALQSNVEGWTAVEDEDVQECLHLLMDLAVRASEEVAGKEALDFEKGAEVADLIPELVQEISDLLGDDPDAAGTEFDEGPPSGQNEAPVQLGPKTGRNEPCPCGSGKKYKKCCGA